MTRARWPAGLSVRRAATAAAALRSLAVYCEPDVDARSLNRHALGLAAATFLAGCEEPAPVSDLEMLPIRYETEELEIATSFDEELCEGDLRWLDIAASRVEQALGAQVDELHTVYAYSAEDIYVQEETEDGKIGYFDIPGCPEILAGCYRLRDDVAIAAPALLPHEIVHIVSTELDPSYVRFWYEGIAEALSEHPIIYFPADLVAESTADDVRYSVPGHFIRWLIQRQGVEPVVRVLEGEAFEDVYGMDLGAIEQVYDVEAADVMPSPYACADEPILPTVDGSFDLSMDLDCAAPTTTRIRHGSSIDRIATIRMVTTETDTTYLIEAEGVDQIEIGGCLTEPGDLVDQLGDVNSDVHLLASNSLGETTKVFPGNEVYLPASTYRVVLLADDTGEPQPIQFTLTPVE